MEIAMISQPTKKSCLKSGANPIDFFGALEKAERAGSNIDRSLYELYQLDLNHLLESGERLFPDIEWKNENGELINLHIAMQELLDEDPWMNEPLTSEEQKCFDNLEESGDWERW